MNDKISIIVLLKNGAKHLPKILDMLSRQKNVEDLEIVVVDSGSTDGSWKMLNDFKLKTKNIKQEKTSIKFSVPSFKLIKIKPSEFGHGKTRNFAVKNTNGELVVFLTQDAVPQNNNWLSNLIEPFKNDPQIAGVFGRQIPRQKTNLCEKYFYSISYPEIKRVMTKNDADSFSNRNIFFSNVNGVARKEFLIKYPFREDLVMSEDQFWGREMLNNGYKIIYEPRAEVIHSHNYNLKQLFRRYFLSGYSQRQMGLKGDFLKKGTGTVIGLLRYIIKTNILMLPYTVLYSLIKGGAFVMGRNKILSSLFESKLLDDSKPKTQSAKPQLKT